MRLVRNPRRGAALFVAALLVTLGFVPLAATPAYADALGYPWANATTVNAATYEWGYSTCPSDNPGCKLFKGVKNGVTYGEADPWGYYLRNCTSYVAWKLSTKGVPADKIKGNGNGGQWAAKADLKRLSVDSTPRVGDAAVKPPTKTDLYGHVAYVEAVHDDGTITVSEYNYDLQGNGHTRRGKPATMGFSKFVHFGEVAANSPPPANPDPDGDGFSGSDDLCPDIWGKYRGCPLKADFSMDGREEVAAWYRHDNNLTDLVRWNGQASLYTSGPYAPWSLSGFDASRLLPAGSGNFNGDRYQDTAAFYAHDGGMIDLDIWLGNASGGTAPGIAWHQDTGWEGARIIPVGAEDFDNDHITDVAAYYRYDNGLVNLYVWYGEANNTVTGPFTVWSGQGWDGSRIIPVGSGDVDGDGKKDIASFYRHDNGMVDYNVWYGNARGDFTLYRPWHVDSGWDASRFIPAGLADINGDSAQEAIVFYRHDNNLVDMRTWPGTASRVISGEPGGPWSASGWDGARIIPAGTGDYNGDGKADVATFYRHDGQMVDMNIWYGNGSGGMTLFRAWHAATGWEGARLIPAKG